MADSQKQSSKKSESTQKKSLRDSAKDASEKLKKQAKKMAEKKPTIEEQLSEAMEGWKRAKADYDNLKKRTAEEKVDLMKFANKEFILELLPVLDNFDSAFTSLPEGEQNNWITGFEYIRKQLGDLVAKYGVEEIECVGKQFDPVFHEAGSEEESEKDSGEVLSVIRNGYEMHGEVIRPARVVVSK